MKDLVLRLISMLKLFVPKTNNCLNNGKHSVALSWRSLLALITPMHFIPLLSRSQLRSAWKSPLALVASTTLAVVLPRRWPRKSLLVVVVVLCVEMDDDMYRYRYCCWLMLMEFGLVFSVVKFGQDG
jgi:hypothetical protein